MREHLKHPELMLLVLPSSSLGKHLLPSPSLSQPLSSSPYPSLALPFWVSYFSELQRLEFKIYDVFSNTAAASSVVFF